MQANTKTKLNKILREILKFLLYTFLGLVYLVFLGLTVLIFGEGSITYFLILSVFFGLYLQRRRQIKEKGLSTVIKEAKKEFIVNTKTLFYVLGVLIVSIFLIILGGSMFVILGWVLTGLSATSIIIVLLILILLK
jgi:Ca2+/Na+ antiporter